jgi:hypothetical protein
MRKNARLARLVALSRKLQKQIAAQTAITSALEREASAYAERVVGRRIDVCESEVMMDLFSAAEEKMGRTNGAKGCAARLNLLDRRLEQIADEILASPTHSLEDLKVKLEIAIFYNPHLWDQLNDSFYEKALRCTIDAASRLAGCAIPGLDEIPHGQDRVPVAHPLISAALH